MTKLKVAIIGGGLNSAVGYAHFSALQLTNKFQIHCGCFSRNDSINNETANAYGLSESQIYSNYKDMLQTQRGELDLVIILTPSDQHFEQINFSIEIGLPIVCEKSLVTDLSELKNIKQKIGSNFLAVVYNYITYPMLIELKNLIKKNKLGKLLQIHIEMPQEGFIKYKEGKALKPQNWRLKDGFLSTLSLDLATHTYSIIRFLTDEHPLEVVAIENSFGNFDDIIDDVNCLIKYTNGLISNMWFSKVALGNRNGLRVRVFGTEGSSEWFQMQPELLTMSDKSGQVYYMDRGSEDSSVSSDLRYNRFKVGHPVGFIEALANFYEDIVDDFSNYKNGHLGRKTFGIEESEECILLLHSITISAREKKWITL